MFGPIKGVPSEGTIEQIANHQLLNLLDPWGSWFFVPTKREELKLGFDASLQGKKALVIQYKRYSPDKKGVSGRITLSKRQHSTLLSRFPKRRAPYVFYAFAIYRDYGSLSADFRSSAGLGFGPKTVFVDAHSLSLAERSVSVYEAHTGVFSPTFALRRPLGKMGLCLNELVSRFKHCSVGLTAEDHLNSETPDATGRHREFARPRHLHILWAPYLKKTRAAQGH